MSQNGNPGCIKSIGFIAVVIFGALLLNAALEVIGGVLFSIPWFVWIILVVVGIYIISKIGK